MASERCLNESCLHAKSDHDGGVGPCRKCRCRHGRYLDAGEQPRVGRSILKRSGQPSTGVKLRRPGGGLFKRGGSPLKGGGVRRKR